MTDVLTLWRRAGRIPLGDRLFSTMFGLRAPYFRSVRPRFTRLEPHHAELVIRDRRRVHNHLGTVHAIALCNGLEAAMGALAEATHRRRPALDPEGDAGRLHRQGDRRRHLHRRDVGPTTGPVDEAREVPVRVRGVLADGTVVVEGVITLWVTPAALAALRGQAGVPLSTTKTGLVSATIGYDVRSPVGSTARRRAVVPPRGRSPRSRGTVASMHQRGRRRRPLPRRARPTTRSAGPPSRVRRSRRGGRRAARRGSG